MNLIKILLKITHHNWWAILFFNFKMLPFKQAIKFPFDFRGPVQFESLKGKILLNFSPVRFGVVDMGHRGREMFAHTPTILSVDGVWKVNGRVQIGCGSLLQIKKDGVLITGNQNRIGAHSKLYCQKQIEIGDQVGLSWECQIFDTNFHYMRDVATGEVYERDGVVRIGNHNWFGNRCNIMKGTITPDNIVVASNSMTNKDYSQSVLSYSLLAGSPVKVVRTGVSRMFEGEDL